MKALFLTFSLLILMACGPSNPQSKDNLENIITTNASFKADLQFLRKHTEILVLKTPNGKGQIAISPLLQGRVMTSSSNGMEGKSYGWINRDLFNSGDTLEHINAYGGEERFWLGPEGGQYSIFFAPEAEFNLETWQTPRLIDLDPFYVLDSSESKLVFHKKASLTNYSGFTFHLEIDRSIEVLSLREILANLNLSNQKSISAVGYQSVNSLTNIGKEAWTKENGLLSIWLLGMFNPSPSTTIVIPYHSGDESELGPIVNDNYFGKVPVERLQVADQAIYFSGDGEMRSKIGLLPDRAKNIIGSYDAENHILTIVKYNKPEGVSEYVNSQWKIQEEPFKGDVVNSYNDGPPEPGAKPLGPFYELETSSPAFRLGAGEKGIHIQETYHFEGRESELSIISNKLLGVSLKDIKSALN